MKVALHSNDLSADGICFTWSRNPGLADVTVGLICTSDAASAFDCLNTATVQQIDYHL